MRSASLRATATGAPATWRMKRPSRCWRRIAGPPAFAIETAITPCAARIFLRNLKHVEDALGRKWATRMRRLLPDACKEVSDSGAKALCDARFKETTTRFRAICDEGRKELPEPPPRQGERGRLPKSEAEKLPDAFVRHENEVLRFAGQSAVPFANSRAERDERMSKAEQKAGGTFRNAVHADACCRVSSCLQSMSRQGFGSLAAVQIALSGKAVEMLGNSEQNHSQINPLKPAHSGCVSSYCLS